MQGRGKTGESERVTQLNELSRRVRKNGSAALGTDTALGLIHLARSASRMVNSVLGTPEEADHYVQMILQDLEDLDLPGQLGL